MYRPAASVILNVSKDHKGVDEIQTLFSTFAKQSSWVATNADDSGLDTVTAQERFGTGGRATWRPETIDLQPDSVGVYRQGREYRLPLPGAHNAANLCAALCVCEHFGCDHELLAAGVKLSFAKSEPTIYASGDAAGVLRKAGVDATSVKEAANAWPVQKPRIALYVGGMGHRDKNFHKDMMVRRGYGEAAARIQDLYLAGRKEEATAAVPDEFC